MIGELGVIRTTTNGGVNWYSQVSNSGNWLHKINYVDTLNGWAVGDYGTIIHTTTGGWLLPTAPSLSGPSNNASCVSLTPTLNWNVVFPPVCTYRVQVSTTSTFNATVLDSSGILYLNFAIPATRLSNGTTYYWRVVATNQVGVGPWSSVRHFTTTYPTPVAPSLVIPVNNSNICSLAPLLDWDSVSSVSTFRIRISDDSTFATTVIDINNLNVSVYQVPLGILQNNIKYYWRVNAANSCVTSPWSQTWNFFVYPTPVAPILIAPANNSYINDLVPLFDWDSVVSANSFRIEVSADSNFATTIIDTSGLIVSNYRAPAGRLQNTVKYYWKVNASNSFVSSPWSQIWNFQALLTTTGNIGSEIPKSFKLYNNYPNPFNPVTKIKFDLPINSSVLLKVYDITGKEVANLVDLNLNAGTYEYQWNADKYSSGVYFYKIETGSFTSVKRMVLIK
jgi:hypothetical protein